MIAKQVKARWLQSSRLSGLRPSCCRAQPTVNRLDTVDVLKSPAYLAVGGANGSPWTKRTAGFRKGILRCEGERLFPGDRTAPPRAAALPMIGMTIAPEQEQEFNE